MAFSCFDFLYNFEEKRYGDFFGREPEFPYSFSGFK